MKKACLCALIASIVAIVAIVVIAILIIELIKHDSNHTPSLSEILSENAIFPNGSYTVQVKSLKSGPPEFAPDEANATDLAMIGVRVDDSAFVAETGRLSYFYIILPSNITNTKSLTQELGDGGATSFTSIGIRFGDASHLNVVPLSLSHHQNSGLSQLGTLPDGRHVLELQVRMPSQNIVCTPGRPPCNVLDWQGYVVSQDNSSGTPSHSPIPMPLACGSQCDAEHGSPCAKATCENCDAGVQVAGADQSFSRRYNMGRIRGNVSFIYETYQIKDRITVDYGGRLLLDSDCVGTNGEKKTNVYWAGLTKELRVDVEPNCLGTRSTKWYFELSCPSPCDYEVCNKNEEGTVLMHDAVNEVQEHDTIYITKEAEMPSLSAYYCGNGNEKVSWKLTIQPTEGRDPNITYCPPYVEQGATNPWKINFKEVQGDNATLTWKTEKGKNGSLNFKILGMQPDQSKIIDEIGQQAILVSRKMGFGRDGLWFALPIGKHESKKHKDGLRQFELDGYPISAYDAGFGMFQLTDPRPTCSQIWSWKENVRGGVELMGSKKKIAVLWMDQQRKEAEHDNGTDASAVPTHIESNCIFQENTSRTIDDAVSIKAYNGVSSNDTQCKHDHKKEHKKCENYCAWDDLTYEWRFNTFNYVKNGASFNYVNRVCVEA